VTSLKADFLVPGVATGALAVLVAPLSLWGGFDVQSGTIVDVTHPQRGMHLAGRVIAMREARGSSSSASALVEAARRGTAPSAIILGRSDPILIIGALVAFDLYGVAIPVVLLPAESWDLLPASASVRISSESSELILE
jgi:hypothetical protein